MDTEGIIWLVVAIVVVLAIIAAVAMVLGRRKKQHDLEVRRVQADQLRHQAAGQTEDVRTAEQRAEATQAEARLARERADGAERKAADAQRQASYEQARQEDDVREADQVDPRVDHQADDYEPTTDPSALKDPLADSDPGDGTPRRV